jgi:hypothetical protein
MRKAETGMLAVVLMFCGTFALASGTQDASFQGSGAQNASVSVFPDCAGEIGDFVWNDGVVGVGCDGIQPVNSSNGLNGLYVRLYEEPSGDLLQEVMTHNYGGIDGYYLFTGLCAGAYRVEVDTPAGMVPTPSYVGDPATNSDGSPAYVTLPTDSSSFIMIDFGFCTEVADEGCSPGYWKNHLFAWGPTGYNAETPLGAVFDLALFGELGSESLGETLYWHGGPHTIDKARNLIKHATAALLNAAHPDVAYIRSEMDLIDDVNAALASNDMHEMNVLKGELDDDNNSGCPLSGRPLRVDKRFNNGELNRSHINRRMDGRQSDRAADVEPN